MENLAIDISTKLYKYINFSREDVQRCIDLFSYYTEKYNIILETKIQDSLKNSIHKEAEMEIKKHFKANLDPFKFLDSEAKRLNIYKKKDLYCDPQVIEIGKRDKLRIIEGKSLLISAPVTMVHISLQHSLKILLEIDGLFNATKAYVLDLEKETNILSNFTQGELWKNMLENFKIENKTTDNANILPLE